MTILILRNTFRRIKKCKPTKEDVNLFRNRISVELDQKINGIISILNEITTDSSRESL